MEGLLKKLQPKWLAVVLAFFILGRAVTAFLSEDFGTELMSDSGQWVIHGLKFSYIGNTIFLPLMFSLLAVELAKNSLSPVFFRAVLSVHFLSVLFVSLVYGLHAMSFGPSPGQGGAEGISIQSESGVYRAIATLITVTTTTILAWLWQKHDYRLFSAVRRVA
ncbi:hypothetical protein [Microbulbifer litoralis]|uniref:hypothetical protein n=1 Tax=Microbulbifer litoralis TaxID=2933965 RepID=UPI002027B7E4|nr:hypothetical protein [Microbulbifer sp. GX H0434]